MVVIILAAALGAIFSIVVVLLFRRINAIARHTAEVGETVRQLTETDVELYRELLRLRRTMNGGPTTGRETRSAAVAGGDLPSDPPSIPSQQPTRRKRHLALYILSSAALALASLIREAFRAYRGRVVGVLAGAAATASTVTVLTVTPWQGDVSHPPSSAPTAASTIHAPEPGSSPSSTPAKPLLSPPPSVTPTPGASPTPDDRLAHVSWVPTLIPIGNASAPMGVPGLPAGGITPSGVPDVTTAPTVGTGGSSPAPSPPSSSPPAGTGVCAGISASPVGSADVCLPLLGGG